MEKREVIQNIVNKQCFNLGGFIEVGRYNHFLEDEGIFSLFFIEDPDGAEASQVEMVEVDGDEYPVAADSADFAKDYFESDSYGFGSGYNNVVVTIKDAKIGIWDIGYDSEYTTADLMDEITAPEDVRGLLNELEVFEKYQEEIFGVQGIGRYIEGFKSALEGVIKGQEVQVSVEDEVARQVELAKADCEIDKIENPKIIEKEVIKIVYEEVEVVKEVKVPCLERVHSFYD